MKTIKYLSIRVLAITALALVFAMPAKAQLTDNGYANIDWQFICRQIAERELKRLIKS